jgi:two-component system, NarL family, nitrate/nitrite response regulator NarL
MGDSARKIRVLLVDDHVLVRTGLRMLIESDSALQVVSEAGTRGEALAAVATNKPDVIVLDIDLGAERGTDFLAELLQASGGASVLVLTGLRDVTLPRECVRRGARGVLLKDQASALLLKAIRKVHEGELWLDRSLTAQLIDNITHTTEPDPEQQKIDALTTRELEVVALVAAGCRNRDIAQRLFISETTVRHHLTAIFSKLELSDRLGLALYAFRNGLAKPK